MQNDPFFYVVAIAMILVVVILMIGITGMARGGEFNRKNANRLMRYRIIAQFIAVILILIFVATRFAGN